MAIRGWAAKDATGIDTKTVGATKRSAMVNWIVAGQSNRRRVMVFDWWTDEQIEGTWTALSSGHASLVEVEITEVVEV